jgi:hypothetical protein
MLLIFQPLSLRDDSLIMPKLPISIGTIFVPVTVIEVFVWMNVYS